jgi:SSS family solute:Na+ symporter
MAEGKGAWLADLHTFPSQMAQNFWIAIFAWTACFLVTIVVSLLTKPHPLEDLRGLVFGLTEIPREEGVPWYRRPGPLALLVAAILVLLNLIFL